MIRPISWRYFELIRASLEWFLQARLMVGFGDFDPLRLDGTQFLLGFGQAFLSTADTPARWVHQKVERVATGKG